MQLLDHLYWLVEQWTAASGRSESRLSTLLVNDGKFIAKLRTGGASTTIGTFEKCIGWFAEPANWPNEIVPAAVVERVASLRSISDTAA